MHSHLKGYLDFNLFLGYNTVRLMKCDDYQGGKYIFMTEEWWPHWRRWDAAASLGEADNRLCRLLSAPPSVCLHVFTFTFQNVLSKFGILVLHDFTFSFRNFNQTLGNWFFMIHFHFSTHCPLCLPEVLNLLKRLCS